MLYAVAQELAAALRADGVPFPVVFGPEATASITAARERIVIEQPIGEKKDQIVAPKALQRNPMVTGCRMQATRIRIFARANVAGAAWHEHTERAEKVLDHVQASLVEIAKVRRNEITWGAGGFIELADEKGSSVWNGAVYELDFTIDRGIFRLTWADRAGDEVVIGVDVEIVSRTKVSGNGAAGDPPADAETASGG